MRRIFFDTTKKYGRLTVVEETKVGRNIAYVCKCDCGTTTVATKIALKNGKTISCGCWKREARKHGHTKAGVTSGTYNSWHNMIQRCTNNNREGYSNYGGRGITVCTKWLKFENFLKDMGDRPKGSRITIDREDNDGNYEPNNCRWLSNKKNQRNKKSTVFVEWEGKKIAVTELEEQQGFPRGIIYKRLKLGWPLEKAVTQPRRSR